MKTETPKDWRAHVLLVTPPGSGAVLWARLQARRVPLRDWDPRQSDSEYLWRIAQRDDQWAHGSNHVAQNFGTRAALDSSLVPVPFRAPHHSVSVGGLVGSIFKGWRLRPGELSLAHGGVLFLDEANEFRLQARNAVFAAMNLGCLSLGLGKQQELWVPAEFRLIATMRPCPCGFRGAERSTCRCSDKAVERWMESGADFAKRCRVVPEAEWRAELEAGKAELT